MGRYRSRSRSYSPRRSSRRSRTPPPKRHRYEDPRDRRSSRRSPGPTGLLVRNISLDARPEDLRMPFERFGAVKDVYIPKNYYTGEPRGFGFVKFRNPEDAAEAKHHLNHSVIGGREIAIVFAEENRKTPHEMRRTSRVSEHYGGYRRRRSPPRSPRRRYHSHSHSPSPAGNASSQKKEYKDHICQKKEFVHTREWKFSKVLNFLLLEVKEGLLDWVSLSYQSPPNKSLETKEMRQRKLSSFPMLNNHYSHLKHNSYCVGTKTYIFRSWKM